MSKKISYTLNFGLIGTKNTGMDSGKEIFVDYLTNRTIEEKIANISEVDKGHFEYFTVYKEIPIKIKVFLFEDLEELISNSKIQQLDVLVLALNLYDMRALERYNRETFEKFINEFNFRGVSVLTGINVDQIYGRPHNPNYFHISRGLLVKKAKELNVLYCYEIFYKYKDLNEFFDKILNDFVFKFQFKSSELFEQAKSYGKELLKQYAYLKDSYENK